MLNAHCLFVFFCKDDLVPHLVFFQKHYYSRGFRSVDKLVAADATVSKLYAYFGAAKQLHEVPLLRPFFAINHRLVTNMSWAITLELTHHVMRHSIHMRQYITVSKLALAVA
jgi:hypothetical protein